MNDLNHPSGTDVHHASGAGEEPPAGIDELLERVRRDYVRVGPREAYDAARAGDGLLVDIRYAALRERDGLIPGAVVVERNELEWRLDPRGSHRLPEATGHDLRVVVICNEGYASSLAAVSLHQLGLGRATDLIGGFQAWRAAGLPVAAPSAPSAPSVPAGARET
ncbi:rhodanese-like domain-containing protein [Streptomyces sp. NPDC018057]|uniref:rhodanese-like domain-containing protein n=1 Tax=unclassified Streptomyces TaxID=2593676 RepID=UPI0037B93107